MLAIQAVVIGLILRAVHRIGAHVLHDRGLWLLALGAGVATLAAEDETPVMRSPDAQKRPIFMKGAGLQVCKENSITDFEGLCSPARGSGKDERREIHVDTRVSALFP